MLRSARSARLEAPEPRLLRTRPFETLGSRLAPQGEALMLRSARRTRLEAPEPASFPLRRPGMTPLVNLTHLQQLLRLKLS
jgi:hypothetical protein